jgi:hypothetical protein
MDNRIEFSPLLFILKHNSTEFGAVERPIFFQDTRTECGYDLVECPGPRTDDVSSENVSVDNREPARS